MDFALILFLLTVFTGVFYVLDVLVWRKQRAARAAQSLADFDQRAASMIAANGQAAYDQARSRLQEELSRIPLWLEYTGNLFPVICMVFLLRSFLVEPFKIPSASMVPTLQAGDLILVNKYNYGIRLPVINAKVMDVGSPKRGDVMVFKFPVDPSIDYIKRVIGLPGDVVEYREKVLSINGQAVPTQNLPDYFDPERVIYSRQFSHQLDGMTFRSITEDEKPPYVFGSMQFPFRDQCEYFSSGVRCTVPQGHYFMMGDNRDNSSDSRVWGFVPERYIVGRAFFIWMNFGQPSRIGFLH